MSKFVIAAACCAGVLISSPAFANLPYQIPSGPPVLTVGGRTYPLKELNDGLGKVAAESNNGFGSPDGTGEITFKLKGCAKIDKFMLWNNINRGGNGITSYDLKFYGGTNNTLLKTISNITPPTNGTPLGVDAEAHETLVDQRFVGKIVMKINSSNTRIEIREVEIVGSARGDNGVCCP